jgi:hypothetical protein
MIAEPEEIRSSDRWLDTPSLPNLRSWLARRQLQRAVDPQLNAADGKQADLGFRLAGLEFVSDSELPFPDAWRCGHGNRVLYAPVIHGNCSIAIRPAQNSEHSGDFPSIQY